MISTVQVLEALGAKDLGLRFSNIKRHTRCLSDWSSDVCSSDLLFRRSDGTARIGSLVWRLQHPAAAPGLGLRHAREVVSFARVLWSQAGGVAVEIGTEAPPASSPPFAPRIGLTT